MRREGALVQYRARIERTQRSFLGFWSFVRKFFPCFLGVMGIILNKFDNDLACQIKLLLHLV